MMDQDDDTFRERSPERDIQERDVSQFAAELLAIRNWEKANLPQFKPQIALDILLYAVVASRRPQQSPTKEVHLEIGYSQDRVRETINLLVNDNWLIREPSRDDRRIVFLQPTERAIRLVRQYEQFIEDSIISKT